MIGHYFSLQNPRLVRDDDGAMAALMEFAKTHGFDKMKKSNNAKAATTDVVAMEGVDGTDAQDVAPDQLVTEGVPCDDAANDDPALQDALAQVEGGLDTKAHVVERLWQRRASELVPDEMARHLGIRTIDDQRVHIMLAAIL